jgi:hypothetical protein
MLKNLIIDKTWDGCGLDPHETTHLYLECQSEHWIVRVDAPWNGDPPPPGLPGHTAGLWQYEVVEFFVAGTADANGDIPYLEVELSPHGHYLVLRLCGVRQIVGEEHLLDYSAKQEGSRWQGRAILPQTWLPPPPWRCNAYAIRGIGEERRYLAHAPTLGRYPDFHTLSAFVPLSFLS